MRKRKYPPSDGELHERLSLPVVLLLIVLSGIVSFINIPLAMGMCLGALCAYFIDPDLDQPSMTRAEYRMYKISKVLGVVYHIYFVPYSLFPHRSVWTHGGKNRLTGWITMALIATPIRIVYSHLWLLPAFTLSPNFREFVSWIPVLYWLGLYVAWAAIDEVHWFRDRWLD